jgi:hypothetical protein
MEQGLALRRQLDDRWGVAGSRVNLAAVCTRAGDLAAARGHLRAAVDGFRAVGDPLGLCECLEAGAELAHAAGRLGDAVRLLAAASRRRELLSAPRGPFLGRTMAGRLAELRAALGEAAYAAACQEGHETGDAGLDLLA